MMDDFDMFGSCCYVRQASMGDIECSAPADKYENAVSKEVDVREDESDVNDNDIIARPLTLRFGNLGSVAASMECNTGSPFSRDSSLVPMRDSSGYDKLVAEFHPKPVDPETSFHSVNSGDGDQEGTIGFGTVRRIHMDSPAETRTWCRLNGTEFNVRRGPNYKKNHQKARSASNLYDCYGVDVMKDSKMMGNFADKLPLQNISAPSVPNDCGIPQIIIMNLQLIPEGGGWGSSSSKSYVSNCSYAVIKPESAALVGTDREPAQFRLLREIARKKESNATLPLKAIAAMVDIDKTSLPSMIKSKNGKPFLLTGSTTIRTGRLAQHPDKPTFLEFDIDQQQWAWFARKTTSSCRNMTKTVSLDVGYLVEATKDSDLPEQMLCSWRVHCTDVTDDVAPFMEDR